jgi:hypothetical protein
LLIVSRKRAFEEFDEEEGEDGTTYPLSDQGAYTTEYAPIVQPMPTGAPATAIQPTVDSASTPANTGSYSDGWSNQQLLSTGWTQAQIDARYTATGSSTGSTALTSAFESLGASQPAGHETTYTSQVVASDDTEEDLAEQTLPSVNCMVSGKALGPDDQWSQCPGCGGWAEATAKASVDNCPRCRSSW